MFITVVDFHHSPRKIQRPDSQESNNCWLFLSEKKINYRGSKKRWDKTSRTIGRKTKGIPVSKGIHRSDINAYFQTINTDFNVLMFNL